MFLPTVTEVYNVKLLFKFNFDDLVFLVFDVTLVTSLKTFFSLLVEHLFVLPDILGGVTKSLLLDKKSRGDSFQTGMSKMGRLTLSKLYLQGKTSVDVDVSQFVLNKWRHEEKEENDKVKRFFATYDKLELDVTQMRNINLSK